MTCRKSNFYFFIFGALVFALSGCYGRPRYQVSSDLIFKSAGLQAGQPAVVTFGALWCHPCREEVDSINRANREFAGSVQFRGFLVEGQEKGSLVQVSDILQFTSFTGGRPEYAIHPDLGWHLFDSLHAPQGRSLPTMLIFNGSGQVAQVVQQSLDYETQLRPLLLALTRGQNPTTLPVVAPPVEAKPGDQRLTDSVENWLARKEVASNTVLVSNFTQSWQKGLKEYSFPELEMPLNSGEVDFVWDGAQRNIPIAATWIADTPISICTLKVQLHEDGTTQTSTGNCRQKQ